jgi:hypothetical protein
MKTGFIFGLLTALAVSVPVMLADHVAIIPGGLVFFVRDSFWYPVRNSTDEWQRFTAIKHFVESFKASRANLI